jgi:hypothetical protein
MALGASDYVVAAASVRGPNTLGSVVIHAERPQFGVTESLVDGPPPTNVVVTWADGTRTQYATSGTGATAVLYQVGPSATYIIGSVVAPTAASGIPNPGGRLQGPVAMQFACLDPGTDAVVAEFVVVETPIGYLVADLSQVAVMPSA